MVSFFFRILRCGMNPGTCRVRSEELDRCLSTPIPKSCVEVCLLAYRRKETIFQHEDWIFGGARGPGAGDDRLLWGLARTSGRPRLLRRPSLLPRRILPIRRRVALLRRWL